MYGESCDGERESLNPKFVFAEFSKPHVAQFDNAALKG